MIAPFTVHTRFTRPGISAVAPADELDWQLREGLSVPPLAVLDHGDQPCIEGRVEVGRQKEPVEDVETLGVALAVGPGLDVAGPEERRHREAGDRAPTLPVLEEVGPKEVLPDSLDDEPLDLGCSRQVLCLLLEPSERRVWQGARELECASKDGVQ